jgi:hypothetical protein
MSEFRDSIRAVVREQLEKVKPDLSRLGLVATYNGMEPRSHGSYHEPATEVSISIHDGEHLVDRLEFFIEREGKPSVSVDEVREWLRAELAGIITDFPHGGGWEPA